MQTLPKLLVLASTYPRWANDTEPGFVHELSKRLTNDFEIHVLAPHSAGAKRKDLLNGVTIHRYRYAPDTFETLVNGGGILTNLKKQPWKLLLILPFIISQFLNTLFLTFKLKPNTIHAHWIIPQGLIAAIVLQLYSGECKLVITSHGADIHSLRNKIFKWLKTFTVKKASKIITVSNALKDILSHDTRISANKVQVLSMGVDLDHFSPDSQVLRKPNQALFVGRFVEKKGLKHLIYALEIVKKEKPDLQLLLVGFGPEQNNIMQLISKLNLKDSVKLLGPVNQSELPNIYRESTVFIAPFVSASNGDQEGLGLVLVEAAGCYCPIVCGNVNAIHDVIKDNETGLIVDPTNHKQLASAILTLLDDGSLRNRLSENAHQYCKTRFDWKHIAGIHKTLLS